MSGGGKSEANEGHLNQDTHRLLCHAIFNPLLHRFCAKAAVKDVNRWSETFSNFGVSWSDKFSPAYQDCVAMAVYMATTSVKLQWLTGVLHDIYNVKKAKVVLFHD